MKKFSMILAGLVIVASFTSVLAQDSRKQVEVPKVDPADITIDGNMDEGVWSSAAEANLITSTGYEIFANKYEREDLVEPEFDELYGRMLWAKDTLYVFIHIDEFVNDSTNLFWVPTQDGHWGGDQLFVSLSNRLGNEMMGMYDGNVYAAPNGPYHFLILGDQVTLNADDTSFIPEEFRRCFEDSLKAFMGSDIARYAVQIDTNTGLWNVEMAIYNPNVNANTKIGFNIGGSMGSSTAYDEVGDAYGYYTWQPNIEDQPYGDPFGNGDPGFYNLANSEYWAVLHFTPGIDDVIRKEVDIPMVDPLAITIDGQMNESEWNNAAHADLITSTGYEIFANKYFREDLVEPEFDEFYGRMLWAHDTLYVFIHIDEFVNDSTNLFWVPTQDGHWGGDQLFVSISNRLGIDLEGNYDGNVYASPDGPYHFLILGEHVTLNGDDTTFVPDEYRMCFDQSDSNMVFRGSDVAHYATFIDTVAGVWDVEMAIYNQHVAAQSQIGFNIGGSTGSRWANEMFGDAYGYYTWQPNIEDQPYGDPFGNGDPGFYNLANSEYWALLNFISGVSDIRPEDIGGVLPQKYYLEQNFPNPFNPTTRIRFSVPETSPVTINIYNSVGQLVTTLVDNRTMSAGNYSVDWNAANLASGVYFYELSAGSIHQTRKMMLLK